MRTPIATAVVALLAASLLLASAGSAASPPSSAGCAGKRLTLAGDGSRPLLPGHRRRPNVIVGTARDERLLGGRSADRLCGRRGQDKIRAGAGRDIARGSSGRDRIHGGPDQDRIRGGSGRDRLEGNQGIDRVWGGGGRDRIAGGRRADRLRGGAGADRIGGGGGRDRIRGDAGADRIVARDGVRDVINCGPGRDLALVDPEDALRRCERVQLGMAAAFSMPSWSDGSWSDPSTHSTIQTGDIDGDGKDELIGRSPFGIEAYRFDAASGNWLPMYNGAAPGLSDAAGWIFPYYYETIQTGDVTGDGKDELLARGASGLQAWSYDPGSGSWDRLPTLTELSDAAGWYESPSYYGTIETANLDGGAEEEVFARSGAGVLAWRLQGSKWVRLTSSGPFSDASGWAPAEYSSTIGADRFYNEDKAILYGRGAGGIMFYELEGSKWSGSGVADITEFADNNGVERWDQPSAYSTIQSADLIGDGTRYVLGRSDNGFTAVSLQNDTPIVGAQFSGSAWDKPQYYETFQTAELDGKPGEEVLARGSEGIEVYRYGGTDDSGFGYLARLGPTEGDFSDQKGWDSARYYETIGSAEVGLPGGDLIYARGPTGVFNVGLNPGAGSWAGSSAGFPAYTSGAQATAYKAINARIGGQDNPRFDLRQAYPEALSADLDDWSQVISSMARPEGVSDEIWTAVKAQLQKELTNGKLVLSWYDDASAGGYLHSLIDDKFEGLSMDTSAATLKFGVQSNYELEMEEWRIFKGVLDGLGGLGALDPPAGEIAAVTSSLVGGATTAGLGPSNVQDAIDGIEGDYIKLRNQLNSDFQSALKGVGQAKIAIQSDYGLQSAIGGLVGSSFWKPLTGDARATALALAERNYDIGAWQTITPAIWVGFQIPPDEVGNWCDTGEDYPAGNCVWKPSDGSGWTLAYDRSPATCGHGLSNGPCEPVQSSLTETLFGVTSSACRQVWDLSGCGMGVSKADAFGGVDGWAKLPARTCKHPNNPRDPALISCRQTRP